MICALGTKRYDDENTMEILIIIMQKFHCYITGGTNVTDGERVQAIIKCRIVLMVGPCTSNFFSYPLPCNPVVNFNHKFQNETHLVLHP